MSDFSKNLLIGLFVIAAVAISIWMILFLKPTIGDAKQTLQVRFSNISGVNVGTQVNLAGKAVGEVSSIAVVKDARDEPSDELGQVYFYQLTLKVDSSVKIYDSDEIAIRTTGLLGEKSIAIIPKAPKKGVIPKLITHEVIYATSIDPIENTLHNLSSLAEKIENVVLDFDQWFMENHDELSRVVKNLSDMLKNTDTFVSDLNQQNVVHSAKNAIDLFSKDLSLIQDTLEEVKKNELVSKASYIFDNIAETTDMLNQDGKEIFKNIRTITDDLAEGKGSLGKLLKQDDLYLRTSAIMSKVDTLMNDINHYGLLFQYNKVWQKSRTKKANLIASLKEPKAFRKYFQTELDDITTSLSRLTILLEKAKSSAQQEKIKENPEFQKDFRMLLKDVEELMDSVKLYNEQLFEKKVCEKTSK